MPVRRNWTEAEDALVRSIGTPGGPLKAEVARLVGCAAWTVHDRMRAIGHRQGVVIIPTPEIDEDLTRDPLPAGHPVSWRPIVDRTCLSGMEFTR